MNKLIGAFLWLCVAISSQAQALMLEVFVDNPVEIPNLSGVDVRLYDLGQADKIEREQLPRLPKDRDQAMAIMRGFMASPAGNTFKESMREASQGLVMVANYQLKKIPAIVFGQGQYVVYGTTDINRALSLYHAHLESNTHE